MESRTRRVHLGLLGFGLILYLWGFVGQTSLASLPPGTAERLTAFPVVFGGVEAASYEEVRFLAEGHPPGAKVDLQFPSGSIETLTLTSAHSVPYLLITLLSGVLFLWISGFLFGPRADNSALRDLMTGTWAYGLAIMIGGVYFPKTPWGPDLLRNMIQLTLLSLLPVVFLHIACVFPRPMPSLRRFEWFFVFLVGMALTLAAWQGAAFFNYFREPGPQTFFRLGKPQMAADTVLVAEIAIGLLILGIRSFREQDSRERSLVRWLLAGFGIGLTPYVFLRTLPGLLGMESLLPPAFDRVFELAIPLAVVFVIVRNRFLDIDVVVRRRLLYSVVALTVFLVAILAVVLVGVGVDPTLRAWHWLPVLGVGLVAGVLFMPVREGIGRRIDKYLFHIRHDSAKALAGFRHRLDETRDQSALARATCSFLRETVVLERVGVVLRTGDDLVVEGVDGEQIIGDAFSLVSHFQNGEPLALRGSTESSHIEYHGFPDSLVEAGFPVAAPLEREPDAEGVILLGAKRSGHVLVAPDLQIVTEAAAVARFALARMRLVQEAERAQIKDRFLARVAHDLRTPLTSIGWSVRNLIDGVAGDLTPSQQDYLKGMDTSASYLGRLVENLLEMGRLERGQVPLDITAHDLQGPIAEAVETVRPIARGRDVRIEIMDSPPVPVLADRGKVVEIAVNLLENAVRFSPDGGRVGVEVGADPPRFLVTDEGPGLGDTDPKRLFSRFEQGAQSPYAGEHGFGIGLHIVASYVQLLGGSVSAANRPQGGARFMVRLPKPDPVEDS